MGKDFTNTIGIIYKITSPNGKIYIGQTINKKQRIYNYSKNFFKQQIKLWNNCKKYNWNPIDTFEIIEECLCGVNKNYLNEREKYWIKYFDSFKNGLNCNNGGHGNLGHIFSKESKKKMSESAKKTSKERSERATLNNTGKKQTEESNKKRTEKLSGIKRSDEFKIKMSNIRKNNPMNKESIKKMSQTKIGVPSKKRKRVMQLTLDNKIIKIWDYAKEAEKELNIPKGKISFVCLGKRITTGGFKWKYYEEMV